MFYIKTENENSKIYGDFGMVEIDGNLFTLSEMTLFSPSEHSIGESNIHVDLELQIYG